ncbi:MAG: sugar phosphate isomerase/epimerase [Clostridia bacterium]|nr:sugar phosphate isomerase/epimerase [Clostridia bacterium]
MALPVAVQVYSVRDYAEKDMRGTLQKIKDMGYDGVEFAGLYGNSAEDVKAMCEEIGLVPVSAHVALAEMREDCDKVIKDYSTIGCKFIVVPYLNPDDRPGAAGWEKTIADIREIGKKAHENGLTLLYHNHDFEFVTIDGKYALDILYDTIPADYLQTEIDTCWVNVGGENPAEYVKKYKGRAPVVHLKDFYGEKSEDMYELIGINKKAPARPGNFEFRPVGSGLQDFPSILKASEYAEAGWVVVEQDKPSMGLTSLESIEKSRKYLESIGY